MKNSTLTLALLLLSLMTAAQDSSSGVKVSIKLSPGITFGRVIDKDSRDGIAYSPDGSSFGFTFGPQFDFPVLKENVYFTTGLWFSAKSIKVIRATNLIVATNTGSSKYNLQYLTIPLAFKFYTNNIAPDVKLYFTLGGTFDIKIAEGVSGDDDAGLKEAALEDSKKLFLAVDGNLLLGTGVQFKIGETTLFAGVSYLRGLINVVNPTWTLGGTDERKPYQSLALKNNSINLDLGIQF